MGTRVVVQDLDPGTDQTTPSPTFQTIDIAESTRTAISKGSQNSIQGIALRVRRKTVAEWQDSIILTGELCYALDTGELKIGDSGDGKGISNSWDTLPNIMGLSNRLTLDENNYKYLTIDDGDLDTQITSPSS